MDAARFDRLTRALGDGATRRGALLRLGGAMALTLLSVQPALAQEPGEDRPGMAGQSGEPDRSDSEDADEQRGRDDRRTGRVPRYGGAGDHDPYELEPGLRRAEPSRHHPESLRALHAVARAYLAPNQ